MPRDTINLLDVFTLVDSAQTGRDRLEALATILDLFPKIGTQILRRYGRRSETITWMWDFHRISSERSSCMSVGCALGMAKWLWRSECSTNFFDMNELVYEDIFFNEYGFYGDVCFDQITPQMVADAIRAYLGRTIHE